MPRFDFRKPELRGLLNKFSNDLRIGSADQGGVEGSCKICRNLALTNIEEPYNISISALRKRNKGGEGECPFCSVLERVLDHFHAWDRQSKTVVVEGVAGQPVVLRLDADYGLYKRWFMLYRQYGATITLYLAKSDH